MLLAADIGTEYLDLFLKILGVGFSGFAFLFGWMAYRLLQKEQERRSPSTGILHSIGLYMGFSIVLALLNLGAEGLKMMDQQGQIKKLTAEKDDLDGQVAALTKTNAALTKSNGTLQASNDAFTRRGEVWTIKGKYTLGNETPVISETEIAVTTHPPQVAVDPGFNSFEAYIFVPRKTAGGLEFPELKISRPLKRQSCTIHFDWEHGTLDKGTINESADTVPITCVPADYEITMGKAINLPDFAPPTSGPALHTEVTKVGDVQQ